MSLKISSLSYAHPGQTPIYFPEFEVRPGHSLLVLGKSGSGKTTLLNLLSGLLRPKTGTVHLEDTEISGLSGQQLDRFRGQNLGIVFQKPHLISAMSVSQNLELVPFFSRKNGKSATELLSELDLSHKANAKVTTLSEGEAQRVSIARALANSPQLILADEPTASLDEASKQQVVARLQALHRAGATVVVVSHD